MYREANASNNIILNHLSSFSNCLSNSVTHKTVQSVGEKMMQPINTAFEQLKAKFLEK